LPLLNSLIDLRVRELAEPDLHVGLKAYRESCLLHPESVIRESNAKPPFDFVPRSV